MPEVVWTRGAETDLLQITKPEDCEPRHPRPHRTSESPDRAQLAATWPAARGWPGADAETIPMALKCGTPPARSAPARIWRSARLLDMNMMWLLTLAAGEKDSENKVISPQTTR